MAMREVRVYDGNFPTFEQMLSGGSAADFPKEVWLQQVQPGEYAVRYKDFKTGTARNPAGQHVQSSEVCRIFSSLEEASENSKQVMKEHWTVRCFIYDYTGAQVSTVSNNKEVGKFAVVTYVAMLLWLGIFAVIGMGLVWILSTVTLLMLTPFPSVRAFLSHLGWVGWTAYILAWLFIGILT